MALFAPLDDLAAIRFRGTDAQEFLHAQLSSDVRAMDVGSSQLTAYCSPQGRVLAILHLISTSDGFLGIIAKDVAEATIKRLGMFVLRADVAIESCDSVSIVAAWGEDLADALDKAGMRAPALGRCVENDGVYLVDAAAPSPAVFIIGPAPALDTATLIDAGLEQQMGAAWKRARIEADVAQIHAATADRFLPQMLGLDELGAVSFRKGCYPGQEVIARARYRGKVKRHLVRGSSPVELAPGDTLSKDGSEAATVLMSARLEESRWRFLAVGKDAMVAGGNLFAADGTSLSLD